MSASEAKSGTIGAFLGHTIFDGHPDDFQHCDLRRTDAACERGRCCSG
jgi:hypothetical protein